MKNIHPPHIPEIHIRKADIFDLPDIMAIYNQAVPDYRSTVNTKPVNIEDRTAWFTEHNPNKHPVFVAEVNNQVVGLCSLSVYRPGRKALRCTAELSYCVDISHYLQGVGSAVVCHAINACPTLGIENPITVRTLSS